MSSKLSVEEVLSNLETRAGFHREQEALHAQQEVHHREQRAIHAAELEKVLQGLEAFRGVAASAVELAQPLPKPPVKADIEEQLPPPGRLMVSGLLRLAVERLQEPFGASALTAEANRRFKARLRKPVGSRTTSDVLRRLVREGELKLVREGKASTEALYRRTRSGA